MGLPSPRPNVRRPALNSAVVVTVAGCTAVFVAISNDVCVVIDVSTKVEVKDEEVDTDGGENEGRS